MRVIQLQIITPFRVFANENFTLIDPAAFANPNLMRDSPVKGLSIRCFEPKDHGDNIVRVRAVDVARK